MSDFEVGVLFLVTNLIWCLWAMAHLYVDHKKEKKD